MKYFDKETNGFYLEEAEGRVAVSDEIWAKLIAAQAEGFEIKADDSGNPIKVDVKSTVEHRRRLAQETRDQAEFANIEFEGVEYQYDEKSKERILTTLTEASVLGVPDTDSTRWVLANNAKRVTTLGELKQIVGLGALRRKAIWDQFSDWDEGPKDQPFEVVL